MKKLIESMKISEGDGLVLVSYLTLYTKQPKGVKETIKGRMQKYLMEKGLLESPEDDNWKTEVHPGRAEDCKCPKCSNMKEGDIF